MHISHHKKFWVSTQHWCVSCSGVARMARGHQKIQSQQKNAKKQAELKKAKGHDQKTAAKAALVFTCLVCKVSLKARERKRLLFFFFFLFFSLRISIKSIHVSSLPAVPDARSKNLQAALWEQASEVSFAPWVRRSGGINRTELLIGDTGWASWCNQQGMVIFHWDSEARLPLTRRFLASDPIFACV